MKRSHFQNSLPPLLSPAPANNFSTSNRVVHHIKNKLNLTQTELSTDSPFQNLTISNPLGQGAFGVTFRVQDADGSNFAIKKTSKLRSGLQEAHNLTKITSETVIAAKNAWTESGHFFLQMELCDQNLSNVFIDSEQIIWAVAADISKAIMAVHKQLILHLDIKPDNILIRQLIKINDPMVESDIGFFSEGSPLINNKLSPETTLLKLNLSNLGSFSDHSLVTPRESYKSLKPLIQPQTTIFQLADFGNSVNFGEVDVKPGDARYLDPSFMHTLIPTIFCDIYSLGASLFEISTNQKLAKEGDFFKKFKEDPMSTIDYWPRSEDLQAAILELLNKTEIGEWRQKWGHKFPDREKVYEIIREIRKSEFSRVCRVKRSFTTSKHINKIFKLMLRLKRTGKCAFAINLIQKFVAGNRGPKFDELTEKDDIVDYLKYDEENKGFDGEGCELSVNGLDLSF
ncbi:Kinase, WEE [Spironucleus salmonicida]|uniref:Kinase, WEE n=1 Tax=Spironucleus salmonicida TaxID=348837 RepID=V6LEF6_9EUKA|nr:Kinase, WEE [Spironucleus salmonicida]|eukprot:EST42895.1 Kinase, WEE [Spironucleus salmonicida]